MNFLSTRQMWKENRRGSSRRSSGCSGILQSCPVTYAGGVGSYEDVEQLRTLGRGHVDVTVGSALDLFGGPLSYKKILELCEK